MADRLRLELARKTSAEKNQLRTLTGSTPGIEIFRFPLLTTLVFSRQLIWLFSRQYDALYDDAGGAFWA